MAFLQVKLLLIVALGVLLRFSLRFSSYYDEIARRVEISSPINAWRRVVEGVTLKNLHISPYDGDTFHESPIFLLFYQAILMHLTEFQIACMFILLDIVTAFLLSRLTTVQLRSIRLIEHQRIRAGLLDNDDISNAAVKEENEQTYQSLMIPSDWISSAAFWSVAIYVLSPYSLLSCVGQSTSVLTNFLTVLTLLSATAGQRFIALLLLALLSFNNFYPLSLLVPVILLLEQNFRIHKISAVENKKTLLSDSPNYFNIDFKSRNTQLSMTWSAILFGTMVLGLFALSFHLEGQSWKFIYSTYIFQWSVSDLTPNIGLFWYFFTEMFDHFRDFFLWVFQLNYFIYIIPLSVNFWENPYIISMMALMLQSLFKPYPTVADFAYFLALLPQWSHLFENMKSTLVISCTIVTCSVLAPILWYLWIILGTANSNFYFGITLAYNVALIFLTTDLMFSHVKREFYVKNLKLYKLCKKEGKKAPIELTY